jgi:2-polyprenyl-3-methyl-5-hydroxy-6-metoxy-1,4-benzoquinol methylase
VRPDSFQPHQVEWTPEKVKRFWNSFGMRGSEFFSDVYGRSLISIVSSLRPERYLDIGCGNGGLARKAAAAGINAVGIDGSPELINQARLSSANAPDGLGLEFHHAPATAIPFAEASFDVASLVEVVEHLDDETLVATLAEARRVLRRGGTLLVTTPNNEDLAKASLGCPDCGAQFHPIQHVRSWSATSLAATLVTAGFSPRIRATRLIEDRSALERFARRTFYRLSNATPHLVALARLES